MPVSKASLLQFSQYVLGATPTDKRIRDFLASPPPALAPIQSADCSAPAGVTVSAARALLRTFRTPPRGAQTLDAAARTLLSVLEPEHQDILRNTAQEQQWPLWVLICGAVARACDHRELHAGDYHADWLNAPEGVSPTPATAACQWCRLDIPNPRRGQEFCCSAHGSGKPDHSLGCPAAIVAGLAPASVTPARQEILAAASVIPAGSCQACGLRIPNARPGQQMCCSRHGSGQTTHSDDCLAWSTASDGGGDAPAAPSPGDLDGTVPDTDPGLPALSFRGPIAHAHDPMTP